MTKEDKIKAAKAVFDYDKDLEKVIVTEDGQCFTSGNLAANHTQEQKFTETPIVVSRDLTEVDLSAADSSSEGNPAPKKPAAGKKK